MTKQDFINRVMVVMNEAAMVDSQGALITGADNAQVDRTIESAFVDGWRRCVAVMPGTWFDNKSFKTAQVTPDLAGGTGYIELPEDFYKLTSLQMTGWVKDIQDASIKNERNSNIQSNDYTRGSELRPVALITLEDAGGTIKRVLEYYSVKKGLASHTIKKGIYIPIIKPLKEFQLDDELPLTDQVLEPLAYLVASTVYTTFEKYDVAKALEIRATEMFPNLITNVKGVTTYKQ